MAVGLLLWNTSNVTHVAEHLKLYAEVGETDFFPKASVSEGLLTAVLHTFLDNELPPYLEDRPVATQVRMWLQHVGTSRFW